MSELPHLDVPLSQDQITSGVTSAFVSAFRADLPNLTVVQEAGGRLPMIIEYDMLDGGTFREFIYGFLINDEQCAYVCVTGIQGSGFLPPDFEATMNLVELRFDDQRTGTLGRPGQSKKSIFW